MGKCFRLSLALSLSLIANGFSLIAYSENSIQDRFSSSQTNQDLFDAYYNRPLYQSHKNYKSCDNSYGVIDSKGLHIFDKFPFRNIKNINGPISFTFSDDCSSILYDGQTGEIMILDLKTDTASGLGIKGLPYESWGKNILVLGTNRTSISVVSLSSRQIVNSISLDKYLHILDSNPDQGVVVVRLHTKINDGRDVYKLLRLDTNNRTTTVIYQTFKYFDGAAYFEEGNFAVIEEAGVVFFKADKIVRKLKAQSILRLKDDQFILAQYTKSGEVMPYLYSNPRALGTLMVSPHRIGIYRDFIKTKNGALAYFSGPLSEGEVIELKPYQPEEVLYRSFDASFLASLSRISLKSSDGFTFPGFLALPSSGTPRAAILYLHGGGCLASWYEPRITPSSVDHFELLRNGYAILSINYKGDRFTSQEPPEDFWEKGYSEKDLNECGNKEMGGIEVAQNYLKRLFPDVPLILWGHSHGSYLTNMAATKHARKFKFDAFISENGIWDRRLQPTEDWGNKLAVDRQLRLFTYKLEHSGKQCLESSIIGLNNAKKQMRRLIENGHTNLDCLFFQMPNSYYENQSPIDYIANLRRPLLIIHGEKDLAVIPEHARRALQIGSKKFVDARSTIFPDEEHQILKKKNWTKKINLFLSLLQSLTRHSKNTTAFLPLYSPLDPSRFSDEERPHQHPYPSIVILYYLPSHLM